MSQQPQLTPAQRRKNVREVRDAARELENAENAARGVQITAARLARILREVQLTIERVLASAPPDDDEEKEE